MDGMTVREYTLQEIKQYRQLPHSQKDLDEMRADLAWFNTDEPRTVYLLTGGYAPHGKYFIRREVAQFWIDEDDAEQSGIITEEVMTGRAFGDLPMDYEWL